MGELMNIPIVEVDAYFGTGLRGSVSMLSVVLPVVGSFAVVVGLWQLLRRGEDRADATVTIAGGVVMGVSGFFAVPILDWLLGVGERTAQRPSPSPSVSPDAASPSPSPSTEPVVREPADLTWLLVVLGILVALLLFVALAWVIALAAARAWQGYRARREQRTAVKAAQARLAATWAECRERHDGMLRKVVHAETDWDALFFTPALTDPSVPATHAMYLAMRKAGTLRDTAGELPVGLGVDDDVTRLPYPQAVEDFALAWDAAERNAQRIGQESIPVAERKTIQQIRTLLALAENSAASQNERHLAYQRAQTLIASLTSIPGATRALSRLEDYRQLTPARPGEAEGSLTGAGAERKET